VGALADLTKDVDNIAIHCKARFRHYDATNVVFEERFAVLLESAEDRNDPSFDPRILKVAKKGARQAAERARTASEESAKARDTEERDKYIASCANPLLASGDYANDDAIIDALGEMPWPEEKYGDRPERDRMKKIFARLRKANQMEPARYGRRKIVVASGRS
jgi:hypothetical protein